MDRKGLVVRNIPPLRPAPSSVPHSSTTDAQRLVEDIAGKTRWCLRCTTFDGHNGQVSSIFDKWKQNEIVEEYRRHREGPDPGTKLKENVGCQVYRIKKFLAVMSRGKKNLADFRFLDDTARIHSWVSSLRQAKMAVTTIQHYVLNVGCFMRFLSETPPQSCRLSRKALVGLRREMGSLRKSLKRGLAVHQTAVKEGKETNILAKATLLRCRELAAKAIPELLDLLEKEPSLKNLWRFYGHFAALLSCIYGHRGGVFQNITIQEVVGARKSSSERAHLINIKFTHNNDDRVKLSKFMCHDTRTADKFYVANLTPQQAMEHRRLFDAALEGAERGSPSKEPTSGKRPAKGKGKQPLKRRAPESPDEELTSGSTTPEGTRMELQESGAFSPESSEHGEEEASEKGSQDEQEPQEPSTPPRKYPARRGKATVLLTPLKSLGSSQKLVSTLKVKKAIFSASSTTLVGINRRKKAAEKVKAAMNRRRKPK
ncbi:unnamed protein product [Leuciscus chuanchicus]